MVSLLLMLGALGAAKLGGQSVAWMGLFLILVGQLVLKSFRLLLTLMTLESLMIFGSFTWLLCSPSQGAPVQLILVFFMVSVSEAALALALLVALVRGKGDDFLQAN